MTFSQPSRELDALVAELVIGLPKNLISINGPIPSPSGAGHMVTEIARYSDDMNAAWEVVEKLTENWCDFSLERAGKNWHAVSAVASATAENAAVAICVCGVDSFRWLRKSQESPNRGIKP